MTYHTTTDMDEEDIERSRFHLFSKLSGWLKDSLLARLIAQHAGGQYRPEKHYMRGPGPKTRAKYGMQSGASSQKTIRPVR
jgi:hypothetical protein